MIQFSKRKEDMKEVYKKIKKLLEENDNQHPIKEKPKSNLSKLIQNIKNIFSRKSNID